MPIKTKMIDLIKYLMFRFQVQMGTPSFCFPLLGLPSEAGWQQFASPPGVKALEN
jgi:hypothetical protein